MVLADAWSNFWNDFGEALAKAWEDVKNFWIGNETTTPYIANFLCAIVVLILGIFLIKLFIKILNKTLKLDKKVIKERSVKVWQLVFLYKMSFLILLVELLF